MKKVYLFAGRTSSGKTFLASKLADENNKTILKSYTNRPERGDDSDQDHIFVDQAFYNEAKANGEIIAETEIKGYFYFTTKAILNEAQFYVIDPQGIKCLLEQKLEDIEFVIIYINCDAEVRRKRFLKRKNSSVALFYSREYAEDKQFTEFEEAKDYDYFIDNSNSDSDVLNVLNRILKYESGACKTCYNSPCEEEVKGLKNVR